MLQQSSSSRFTQNTSKKILILGFSFKSNTNDTRYSPSISIAKELLENGANLFIHDPKVNEIQISSELEKKDSIDNNESRYNWSFTKDLQLAFTDAEAIVLLTEWEEYKNINWTDLTKRMKSPAWLFDTRGIIDDDKLLNTNINFWKIGKGIVQEI